MSPPQIIVNVKRFEVDAWRKTVATLTPRKSDAYPSKRQRISHLSHSATDHNNIVLIRRDISLSIIDTPTCSIFFTDTDNIRESSAIEVDFELYINENTNHATLKVLSKNTCTILLSFEFNTNELPVDVWRDFLWSSEVQKEVYRKQSLLFGFQSCTTLQVTHVSQRKWLSILSTEVTAPASNNWSSQSIKLSTNPWWRIVSRSLPNGKPSVDKARVVTPHDFYLSAHVPEKDGIVPDSVQHKDLDCELLPFQRRGVKWMLQKEGVQLEAGGSGRIISYSNRHCLPPTFFEEIDKDGQKCFVSHILGIVSKDLLGLQESFGIIKGGILAEEMGLGKTVELIALMCLHRRFIIDGETIFDEFHGRHVIASKATLIITPPSILHQWKSEISSHAPGLKFFIYEGLKRLDQPTDEIISSLLQYDVVLTTYPILSSEVHYARPASNRVLRNKPVYKPKRSPLIEISWWRVCLDEAQMIESGVSNAAIVCRQIPRINAWAVTGTPVRKDIDDCHGLLLYLRYEPFTNKNLWLGLTRQNHGAFRSLFNFLTLRHSKDIVRDEINLPPQNRVVVSVSFSQVEEQNYQHLFDSMCNAIGVDSNGGPLSDDWEPGKVSDDMRVWLMRLRQTCLHPEAGERNRKAFGLKGGPLRTVQEVLAVMIDQHLVHLRNNERLLFGLLVKRGQMHDYMGNIDAALNVWKEVLKLVQTTVIECRIALEEEVKKSKESKKAIDQGGGADSINKPNRLEDQYESDDNINEEGSADKKFPRLNAARARLRSFLEIEHACYFWIATAYYQLKEKIIEEGEGEPGKGKGKGKEKENGCADNGHIDESSKSDNRYKFEDYSNLESGYYELAAKARLELVRETRTKALKYMSALENKKKNQSFVTVPDFDPPNERIGTIEGQPIFEEIRELASLLNEQVITLDEWREVLIGLLLETLFDQHIDGETQGNEIEVSAEKQEESYAYMSAVRGLVADREESLTEIHNNYLEQDITAALETPGKNHSKLFRHLIAKKNSCNPATYPKSMKRLMNELRSLVSKLKLSEESGNRRAGLEKTIVEGECKRLQKLVAIQAKACAELQKEISQFRGALNARIEFYRQVQAISDILLPLDVLTMFGTKKIQDSQFNKAIQQENRLRQKITDAKSKNRYLTHLSGKKIEESPSCLICMDPYEIGIIANCGHSFCKECILLWFKNTRKCPACNTHLSPQDFFHVTYRPRILTMQKEKQQQSPASDPGGLKIYTDVDNRILNEIKGIDLPWSYGSKIDMITRHLLWLKKNEPGFKAVIFSQWSDVLDVIKGSLKRANIGFASLEKRDGIEKFRKDSNISCFFLHAKSQSAGLTLVNAAHVFLCEPLLNVALELQAISRVHRIGQKKTTTVWLYAVNNTVEQSVLQLSTRRRMAFISNDSSYGKESSLTLADESFLNAKLTAADSDELRQGLAKFVEKTAGGGEMVANEDLWDCLFSNSYSKKEFPKHDLVRRELMAHAAEQRIDEHNYK